MSGIALISYADITITGRAFATKRIYQADPNKELYALGFANFANGLAQDPPGSAYLSVRGTALVL